jgi:hypothetical protein
MLFGLSLILKLFRCTLHFLLLPGKSSEWMFQILL